MGISQDRYGDDLLLNKIRLMLRTIEQPGKPGQSLESWMTNDFN
jgi:hypothetical protein